MAKERECLCCLKKYTFCPSCSGAKDEPEWKSEFDEESCKEIFNAVSGYNMGIIPAKDVVAVLKKYNITDTSKYKKSIKNKLDEVIEIVESEEKAEGKTEVKTETPMKKYDNKKFNK
jgi:hypothetical protein